MPPSRDMKLRAAPCERSAVTVRLRQHVGARRTATMADATSCPPRRCAARASLMRTPRKRADSYLRQCCDAAALLAAAVWSAPLVHAAACATLAANWRLLRGKMHGGKQQLRIGCGQSSRDSKGPFLRSPFWRGLFFPLVNGTQPKDLAVRHGEPRGSVWCVRRPRRQLQAAPAAAREETYRPYRRHSMALACLEFQLKSSSRPLQCQNFRLRRGGTASYGCRQIGTHSVRVSK